MTLTEWQARLKAHFSDLRRRRLESVGNRPIFALEHGLTTSELQALDAKIRAHIKGAPPLNEHALPWIVYAAEVGYRYAGDEYWQTFAAETSGWELHGSREWLRERFEAFRRRFGGAKPSGPFAENFSIICWPICHAILPQDLQVKLAEILYYMRDLFSAALLRSPEELGKRIAARSWNANSRFQNLAQEPLLIGQIAAALLLQGTKSSESLILPSTLKRIGEDLDRVRAAREWLRGAQARARRVHFYGLSSGNHSTTARSATTSERTRQQTAALGIEPRLLLRPTGPESWTVLLEFPDFSHVLAKFPSLLPALSSPWKKSESFGMK